MRKAWCGFLWLAVAMPATPLLAASPPAVPMIAAPDTPARCRSTGTTGACPEGPSYSLPDAVLPGTIYPREDCDRWSTDAFTQFAERVDRRLNRDAAGGPIFLPLAQATWLIKHQRWEDARHSLIGFEADNPEWDELDPQAKRLRSLVGRMIGVLHRCLLGVDYSIGVMPAPQTREIDRR